MTHRMYESRCKTCNSKHRDEIEEKRLDENMALAKISDWLEKTYDEQISKQSLSNHFKKHVMENLEQARKSEMKQREIAKNEVDKTLNLIDELKGSIKILKNMLDNMLNKEELERADVNSITKCLSEVRLTVKELNDLTGSLEIGDLRDDNVKEEFFEKIVSRLDNETSKRILEIWEDAEEEIEEEK